MLSGLGPAAFQCDHVFHGQCLALEVLRLLGPGRQREEALGWISSLAGPVKGAKSKGMPTGSFKEDAPKGTAAVGIAVSSAKSDAVVALPPEPVVPRQALGKGPAVAGSLEAAAWQSLESLLLAECPLCGELCQRILDRPFGNEGPGTEKEMSSW